MDQCYFKCGKANSTDSNAGPTRIKTVIKCSILKSDNLHEDLQKRLDKDPNLTILCHRNCISTYTSSDHNRRGTKNKAQTTVKTSCVSPIKRIKRSELQSFNFKEHCIFCGNIWRNDIGKNCT